MIHRKSIQCPHMLWGWIWPQLWQLVTGLEAQPLGQCHALAEFPSKWLPFLNLNQDRRRIFMSSSWWVSLNKMMGQLWMPSTGFANLGPGSNQRESLHQDRPLNRWNLTCWAISQVADEVFTSFDRLAGQRINNLLKTNNIATKWIVKHRNH